jgi:hypothetical protein
MPDSCAAYLECLDEEEPTEGEEARDWACCAQFAIVIWNKNDPTIHQAHGELLFKKNRC